MDEWTNIGGAIDMKVVFTLVVISILSLYISNHHRHHHRRCHHPHPDHNHPPCQGVHGADGGRSNQLGEQQMRTARAKSRLQLK